MVRQSSRNAVPNRHDSIERLDLDSSRVQRTTNIDDHGSRQNQTDRPVSADHDDERTHLLGDGRFFEHVVDGVISHDRERMGRVVGKAVSLTCAVINCLCAGSVTAFSLYGPLFQSRLGYSQYQVNAVSIAAEIAMYLPVPLFGYLCDRYQPRWLSLFAGCVFAVGYSLAAWTYEQGPVTKQDSTSHRNLLLMILGFVSIGAGTSCMYLAAVTTCAKNFGRGKHKGIALAVPIAAFGLSGMWESQVGDAFFRFSPGDENEGLLNVPRFFIFLAILLIVNGILGVMALQVVDEAEIFEEAIEELERSGLLVSQHDPTDVESRMQDSQGRASSGDHDTNNSIRPKSYGTIESSNHKSNMSKIPSSSDKHDTHLLAAKKTMLLNLETRKFLTDPTMWLLALGFFLTTGPGETFINNIGTVVLTAYRPASAETSLTKSRSAVPFYNTPATHVSIIAVTSTIARLLTGLLCDLFAPAPGSIQFPWDDHTSDSSCSTRSDTSLTDSSFSDDSSKPRHVISRLYLLLLATILFSIALLALSTTLPDSYPKLFPAVSALVGFGYGAIFSLTPIIISAVWGVENFGTNWGIVVVAPAAGAAMWSAIFSAVYEHDIDIDLPNPHDPSNGSVLSRPSYSSTLPRIDPSFQSAHITRTSFAHASSPPSQRCYGPDCYNATFAGMTVACMTAMILWGLGWRTWNNRGVSV